MLGGYGSSRQTCRTSTDHEHVGREQALSERLLGCGVLKVQQPPTPAGPHPLADGCHAREALTLVLDQHSALVAHAHPAEDSASVSGCRISAGWLARGQQSRRDRVASLGDDRLIVPLEQHILARGPDSS
jgi:hypothetical protein